MRRPQLILFHFAGGNCYSFQFLTPYLTGFDVTVVELPGRGRRMREPLISDFDAAARDLYRQVSHVIGEAPFMLYGHSMGAYLALRVANLLEQAGHYPNGLVLSGNAGPGLDKADKKLRYLMDRASFIEELKLLGGMPAELLENDLLFDIFEPILRADFEVTERNNLAQEKAVQAPIFAIMGSEEQDVAEVDNWGRFTKRDFKKAVLPGDHFFIRNHAARLANMMNEYYYDTVRERKWVF